MNTQELAETIVSKWENGSTQPYALVDNDGIPDWYHPTDATANHLDIITTAYSPMDIIGADWSEVEACHNDLVAIIAQAFDEAWAEHQLNAVMTSEEIAETYGIDTSTIRRACLYQWIPARKAGKNWLIRREDAEKRWGKGGKVTLYRPDAQ